MKIIGLYGFASSGKDTVGELLNDYGFENAAYADLLRSCMEALNPILGVSIENDGQDMVCLRYNDAIESYGYEDAKRFVPEIRGFLQRLGTGVGRELIDPNFWVDSLMKKIDGTPRDYVITDVRFPNEYAAVKERGGLMVKIERPGVSAVNDHVSESLLVDAYFDYVIENNGSLEELEVKVEDLIKFVEDNYGA